MSAWKIKLNLQVGDLFITFNTKNKKYVGFCTKTEERYGFKEPHFFTFTWFPPGNKPKFTRDEVVWEINNNRAKVIKSKKK